MNVSITWHDGMCETVDLDLTKAGRFVSARRHPWVRRSLCVRVGRTPAGLPRYVEDSSVNIRLDEAGEPDVATKGADGWMH